jgi:hypothetical protein
MDALDLDVFEIRPVGRLISEPMGQIEELQPHAVVQILLERHTANLLRHGLASRDFGARTRLCCPGKWYACIV